MVGSASSLVRCWSYMGTFFVGLKTFRLIKDSFKSFEDKCKQFIPEFSLFNIKLCINLLVKIRVSTDRFLLMHEHIASCVRKNRSLVAIYWFWPFQHKYLNKIIITFHYESMREGGSQKIFYKYSCSSSKEFSYRDISLSSMLVNSPNYLEVSSYTN